MAFRLSRWLNLKSTSTKPARNAANAKRTFRKNASSTELRKAEGKRQKAGDRRSKGCESRGVLHHSPDHLSYLFVSRCQTVAVLVRDVTAVACKVQPNLCFGGFAV